MFDNSAGRLMVKCSNPDVHHKHLWNPYAEYPEENEPDVTCPGLTSDDVMHIGRSWDSHQLEDECPCTQEPCGLVARNRVANSCTQHPPQACKTIRQGHRAGDCPGRRR
jgi:hypothetical protein